MGRSPTSHDLLAHFDRPKTFAMPEFEGVDELLSGASHTISTDYFVPSPAREEAVPEPHQPTKRGVGWVLQWAAASAVLFIAAGFLIQFACGIAAEHKLVIAARAGAMEATLPRATCESVIATIERRLASCPRMIEQLHVSLEQNDSPVSQRLIQRDSDRFSVTLWAPSNSLVPDWLRTLTFWGSDSRIQARAESRVPGRKLTVKQSIAAK